VLSEVEGGGRRARSRGPLNFWQQHGDHFDPSTYNDPPYRYLSWRDVWVPAYLSPQPGSFFGHEGLTAPREILRSAPFGPVAFANSDLAGAMDHRYSILEAQRAVELLLHEVLLT
jgi:hypothetical protein